MRKSSRTIVILFLMLFAAVLLGSVFCSCTPQGKLNRLLKKHPELVHRLDTTIADTVITHAAHFDTTLQFSKMHDTIRIFNHNVETKIFHHFHSDTLYVGTTVRPDTIIKYIKVPAKELIVHEQKPNSIPTWWFVAVVFLFLLIGLLKYLRKASTYLRRS